LHLGSVECESINWLVMQKHRCIYYSIISGCCAIFAQIESMGALRHQIMEHRASTTSQPEFSAGNRRIADAAAQEQVGQDPLSMGSKF